MSGLLSGAAFGGALLGGGAAAFVPQSADDDARFFAAVDASGGTISAERRAAVSSLFSGLKADGVWNKLTLLWPCAGDDLAAALVGYRIDQKAGVALVGTGYAEGSYAPALGLTGSRSPMSSLDSGIALTAIPPAAMSCGVYVAGVGNSGGVEVIFGANLNSTGSSRFYAISSDAGTEQSALASVYSDRSGMGGTGLRAFSYSDAAGWYTYSQGVATQRSSMPIDWQSGMDAGTHGTHGTHFIFGNGGTDPLTYVAFSGALGGGWFGSAFLTPGDLASIQARFSTYEAARGN